MDSKQKTIFFWLIFIIIVAAVAIMIIPRYGTLSKQLSETQARNLVANLTSSSAANYTQRKYNPTTGIAIINCKDIATLMGNHLPTSYQIADQRIQSNNVALCTLTGPHITPLQFSIIGIK